MTVDLNDTEDARNKNVLSYSQRVGRGFREIFRRKIISLFSADSLHAVRVTGHETALQMLLNFLVRPSRERRPGSPVKADTRHLHRVRLSRARAPAENDARSSFGV